MPICEVLHQDRAQDRLQRALRANRVPHAFLFTGPDGVGKEMLARRFAQVLICSTPRQTQAPQQAVGRLSHWQDACGQCPDCQLMSADNHPDFHRIYRTLGKLHPLQKVRDRKASTLSIDVIRHFLIEKIGLQPSRGRAKVFLITEAESLKEPAQNAMLKTLEEPPAHSYLILLATSADSLLKTTKSRCQTIQFHHLPGDFVRAHLTTQCGLSTDAACFLAELSGGSIGKALSFVRLRLHEQVPQLLKIVAGAGRDPLGCGNDLLASAQSIAKTWKTFASDLEEDTHFAHRSQELILAVVATILRDVQRRLVGHPALALPRAEQITHLARHAQTEPLRKAIAAVATAEYHIGRNVNAPLIFDSLGIDLGRGLYPHSVTA